MRLGYIQEFQCEATIIPKGVIGSLEGLKHRASHSLQYLNSLFWYSHVLCTTEIVSTHIHCEAGVYTCTCRI